MPGVVLGPEIWWRRGGGDAEVSPDLGRTTLDNFFLER